MILESSDFAGTPQLDYEAFEALIHSEYRLAPKISEPKAFAGWVRPLSVCGFAGAAVSIQCGSATMDGCNAYRVERTRRDAHRDDVDYYRAVFSVDGRPTFIQNERALKLKRGDVALVDMGRPWICSRNSGQWLLLHLPRKPLVSHLGFEPQGGLHARGGTLATRLLSELIRDAIEDEASQSTPPGAYLRLAVYDLLGALFAPSDAFPTHTDKLFERICKIIKDRFADPDFGPGEVAAGAGISLRYLQKLFTARGSTCIHYIQSLRLDHAAHLLHRRASLGTGQPLSEIAYASGFNDYPYFVRKFRQRFGYPPSAHAGGYDPRSACRGTVKLFEAG